MTWIWIGKDTDVEINMGRNDRNMEGHEWIASYLRSETNAATIIRAGP